MTRPEEVCDVASGTTGVVRPDEERDAWAEEVLDAAGGITGSVPSVKAKGVSLTSGLDEAASSCDERARAASVALSSGLPPRAAGLEPCTVVGVEVSGGVG